MQGSDSAPRRRIQERFKSVCLVDALRAFRYKVPYLGHGPFWAIKDGSKFLEPFKLLFCNLSSLIASTQFCKCAFIQWCLRKHVRSVSPEALKRDGQFLLYYSNHFIACRVCDGQVQINFSHRSHTWVTALLHHFGACATPVVHDSVSSLAFVFIQSLDAIYEITDQCSHMCLSLSLGIYFQCIILFLSKERFLNDFYIPLSFRRGR